MCNPGADAQRGGHLDPVPTVASIHCGRSRHRPPPPPFDQSYAVPDGLSHSLGIALVEEAGLHLAKVKKGRGGNSVTSRVFLAGERRERIV